LSFKAPKGWESVSKVLYISNCAKSRLKNKLKKKKKRADLERPRVDFIKILPEAFTWADPKSAKRQSSCQFFVLLGSACSKAVRRMLMKLTPNFQSRVAFI